MIGEKIKYFRLLKRYSQEQIARKMGITQGAVSQWEKGRTVPDTETLIQLARLFDCSVNDLTSDAPVRDLDSINIVRNAVPIIGSIACGERVSPDTEKDGYADLPDGISADFALRCRGDSMIPTFNNGDLVLIRQQPEVENGQIAAVNIEGETTLKHLYHQDGGILLVADNPAFAPVFVPADKEIIVHGLAVGYVRMF
jgi:repressor LexA